MSESQADQLAEIAFERYDFGVSTDGTPYAVLREGSCVARVLHGRASLRKELALAFRDAVGKVPSTKALSAALEVLEGACADAEPQDVHIRVARLGNEIYLDLGAVDNATADSFVRISGGGWELVPIAPCLFRRSPLTGRLPKPEAGGSIETLFQFLNLDIGEARLIVGFMVAALLEDIPHPVLVIDGVQGSGKTTVARIVLDLIDPSPAPLRTPPRNVEDFAVMADNSWAIGLDNLSGLSPWMSDTLCRTVTGDGMVRRALYTDSGLAVNRYQRVVVLNGIDPGVTRGDLVDRSLFVETQTIPPDRRRRDREIRSEFKRARPEILGALLDVTQMTLMTLSSVHLDVAPRMADFAEVLAAMDQQTGWSTLEDFTEHTERAQLDGLETEPVAAAVLELVGRIDEWEGTATELLAELARDPRAPGWPTQARDLSVALKRNEPSLHLAGVQIDRRRSGKRRIISINKTDPSASQASPPSSGSSAENEDEVSPSQAVANVLQIFPEAQVVEEA